MDDRMKQAMRVTFPSGAPLLQRIEDGEIDPSSIVTHTMKLDEAPDGDDDVQATSATIA